MAKLKGSYSPRTMILINRAKELIDSVPYKVSLRWVFYRLLQEGFYSRKKDYESKWVKVASNLRKNFLHGWYPSILADETRQAILRTGGEENLDQCLEDLPETLADAVVFDLDHFYRQERYVEIWFEARAMTDQFKYYTDSVDLIPFGGHPSIPFKWEIAERLERKYWRYGKDITVLYFGDLDEYGMIIFQSALKDIREWCEADFSVEWGGLTEEQVHKYDVPENPDKPGEYQWEALSDLGASEIIRNMLTQFIDVKLPAQLRTEEREAETEWQPLIRDAVQEVLDSSH